MRLSHRGLSPYELSAALRHVLESYKSQRNHHQKQPAFSPSAAKNARQTTPVTATKGDCSAATAGSPREAGADAIPPAVVPPGETEETKRGPTVGSGAGISGARGSNQGRTVAFAENDGGPEEAVVSDAGASAAEAEEAAAQASDRAGGGGSSASAAAVASATEKAEKGATVGGREIGTKRVQASRSAFAEQDWRALEPDLTQFCHKVLCARHSRLSWVDVPAFMPENAGKVNIFCDLCRHASSVRPQKRLQVFIHSLWAEHYAYLRKETVHCRQKP